MHLADCAACVSLAHPQADRSGWVLMKPQEGDEPLTSPNSCGRSFTRTMESTVPMYCNLEVSLGLAVVEHKVASLLTGTAAAGGCLWLDGYTQSGSHVCKHVDAHSRTRCEGDTATTGGRQ